MSNYFDLHVGQLKRLLLHKKMKFILNIINAVVLLPAEM